MSTIYLGGDQAPLRQGLLRAAAMRQRTNDDIRYFKHNIDGIPGGKLEVRPDLWGDARNGWITQEWNLPFRALPVCEADIQHAFGTSLQSDRQNRQLAEFLHRQLGSYRRALHLPAGDAGFVLGDLAFRRWPGLRETILPEFEREAEWAAHFAPDDPKYRLGDFKDWLAEVAPKSRTIWDLEMNIGHFCLGNLLRGVRISSSLDLFRIGRNELDQHNLLLAFLQEPAFLRIYNQVTQAGPRVNHQGELPFWIIQKQGGHYVRYPLEKPEATSLAGLRQELGDSAVAVVPKALLLAIQLRQIGELYFTQLCYLHAAQRLAEALGVYQHPCWQVSFDLKRAMGNNYPVIPPDWRKASAPQGSLESQALLWARHRADQYWRGRPTVIFSWTYGSYNLIEKLTRTAKISKID